MKPIAALVAVSEPETLARTLSSLRASSLVGEVAVAGTATGSGAEAVASIPAATRWSSASVRAIFDWFAATGAEHLLWVLHGAPQWVPGGLERTWRCACDSGAAITYGDYLDIESDGSLRLHPLIDYQPGSLRDDFDFGAAVLLRAGVLGSLELTGELTWGAWYDLRLRASEAGSVVRIPEPLYQLPAPDRRASGDRVFDYVDPRQRDYQAEMEKVATAHLRRIGAWLPPPAGAPVEESGTFSVTASVVIPVRDRVTTVTDAVESALAQRAPFEFNVLVVDNHSQDGTTGLVAELSARNRRVVHLQPERLDLGIGGCWQHAIDSEHCGRYAVQLDSDDIYDGTGVLARIVAELERGYAVVIGSYTTVSFDREPLPPGLVDHREWSDENGHNNALRIAGLGAPRAYHVPTLRTVGFPNVSYGEDYAVVLRLCRSYRLGRIYESLYWCRRWQGNTDSALPLEVSNRYHVYKDRLRSIELAARKRAAGR
jgi:hypothetical protein